MSETNNFTPESIKTIGIKPWLNLYLKENNPDLLMGIKYYAKHFYGPKIIDPEIITRTTGHEREMQYIEDQGMWDSRVAEIEIILRLGKKVPPIIVADFLEKHEGTLMIADGNHRFQAGQNTGIEIPAILCLARDPRNYNLGLNVR